MVKVLEREGGLPLMILLVTRTGVPLFGRG